MYIYKFVFLQLMYYNRKLTTETSDKPIKSTELKKEVDNFTENNDVTQMVYVLVPAEGYTFETVRNVSLFIYVLLVHF